MASRDKPRGVSLPGIDALRDASLTTNQALPTEWYERPVIDVARALLGCLLVSTHGDETVAGLIVETEAYDGQEDPASHSAFRRTGLVTAMWGPRGTAYVYRAYGMYPCFNVIAGPGNRPSAVLVRAIHPLVNLQAMARRTGRAANDRVASGPGLTGRALGIEVGDNGHPLQDEPLWIQPGIREFEIISGPRIGITRAVEAEWRFGVRDNPSLSRKFP
ncbi:MAG TPA: DNA-3-methyladenine glycosylase [Nitrolancea sp.]|nr:DNA-3-methyladenine glycosylase [Nitrolancea sp.]